MKPEVVRFRFGPYGRPELDDLPNCTLRFNLSHSQGIALIALANRAVGVDVECVRDIDDLEQIATTYFSDERVNALRATAPSAQRNLFYSYWTEVEAVLKARGIGLNDTLSAVTWMPLSERAAVASVEPGTDDFLTTYRFMPVRGYQGAVAAAGADWQLRRFTWPRS